MSGAVERSALCRFRRRAGRFPCGPWVSLPDAPRSAGCRRDALGHDGVQPWDRMPHQLRLGLRAAHDLLEPGQERPRGRLVTELQIDEDLARLGDAAAHPVGLHPCSARNRSYLSKFAFQVSKSWTVFSMWTVVMSPPRIRRSPDCGEDTRRSIPDPGDFRRHMLGRWLPHTN